ncbi:MAG: YHS domain-containing protein [Planctomycetota bacterium]|jgi:YHS domain-containing protein/polyferredoxin
MTGRLKIAFPYLLFCTMAGVVIWSNYRMPMGNKSNQAVGLDTTQNKTMRDPVCNMDVNPAWGFVHTYQGKDYYFCVERCRRIFAADPEKYLVERCMVCRKALSHNTSFSATYLNNTYYLCSEQHRSEFKGDPAGFFMHRMWGIPDWMYYISIATVLVGSFLMFEGLKAFQRRRVRNQTSSPPRNSVSENSLPAIQAGCPAAIPPNKRNGRIDLIRFRLIRRLLWSRPFRFLIQLLLVAAFLLIIAAGLFGNQNPALNIAPLLTWTIWWGGLVILIMFAGKAWCYMCPWDAIATWLEKLRLWKKTDDGTGLGMPWPKIIRNIAIATILFVGLTWIELGFGVTMRPAATAYLGIAMLIMAIVSAFLFEGKSFCRYGCLIGRVSGLYALFSGIEVRNRDRQVCRSCKSKECIKGSVNAYGCPTFEYPGNMEINTYCIQCCECLQACPHDNLGVNLRPWGADLAKKGKPRTDEAYLALLMLGLTGFHGLTMTPVWEKLVGVLESILHTGQIIAFTLGMIGLMTFPVAVYSILVWLSYKITNSYKRKLGEKVSYGAYFVRYAYCVLPIALFYHLAHNLEHLLMEGPKVAALLSDPFGWGWNLLGTARWVIPPLASLDVLWVMQVVLVGIGHVYSLWVAQKISRRIFHDQVAASRGQWPILAGMIAFSIFSLWLLKQPMEMRTSAM